MKSLAAFIGGYFCGKRGRRLRVVRGFSALAPSWQRKRPSCFSADANFTQTVSARPPFATNSLPLTCSSSSPSFLFENKFSGQISCPAHFSSRHTGLSFLRTPLPSSRLNLCVSAHSSETPPSVSPRFSPDLPSSSPSFDDRCSSTMSIIQTSFYSKPLFFGARLSGMQFPPVDPPQLMICDMISRSFVAVARLPSCALSASDAENILLRSATRFSLSASFSPSAAIRPRILSRAAGGTPSSSPRPLLSSFSTAVSPHAAKSRAAFLRAASCIRAAASSAVAAHSASAASSSAADPEAHALSLRWLAVTLIQEPSAAADADAYTPSCRSSSLACRLLQCRFLVNTIHPVRRLPTSGRHAVAGTEIFAGAAAVSPGAAGPGSSLLSQETTSVEEAEEASLQAASRAVESRAGDYAAAAEARVTLQRAAAVEGTAGETAAAAEAGGRTANARKRTARTAMTRDLRAGTGALKERAATKSFDNAAVTAAGKAWGKFFFHSTAGPSSAATSTPTHSRAAPAGNSTSANHKPQQPSAAAGGAAAAASSVPTSAAGDGGVRQQEMQQLLSEVPFVKKREMNLKAGPYRRGRIFISPREDPLEFILSCFVVFVMLYTLYKLPRGEYLWERRKRVIRERLLKEYGLTEEDMEDVDDD